MEFTYEQINWIRNEMETVEKTKMIPESILEMIYEKKLFKLFVDDKLGGRAEEFPAAIKLFQQASYIDGNFGWAITIGSGGGMFSSCFYKDVAETYFTPVNAVIAGSGFPAGKAKKVENGYLIDGEWKYCSGTDYASTFTANCIVKEAGDEPKVVSFILNRNQIEVVEEWGAFGLKGTSSHSIRVNNKFVPADHTFSIFEMRNKYVQPTHHFPFVPFSEASFAAIVFGIGKHFLEEVKSHCIQNKSNWEHGSFNRYEFVRRQLHTEMSRLESAEAFFHTMVETTWNTHNSDHKVQQDTWQEFSLACKQGASTVIDCAQNLFRFMGMEAVMEHSSLNRVWRDLHTAGQHAFLTPYQLKEDVMNEKMMLDKTRI